MKLCWLVPDDRGGGVVSVALSCVRQAAAAGHAATLLLALPPSGWLQAERGAGYTLDSLGLVPPAADTPTALLRWLQRHPQDVLVLNGCEQADAVIPYLPVGVSCLYVVHDTAPRYWQAAIRHEADLDLVVAVSQTVADEFRGKLRDPDKLCVVHNGSYFPLRQEPAGERPGDLLFLGGDNLAKGAVDVLRLWKELRGDGFAGELHWFGNMEPAFARSVRALPGAAAIHLRGRTGRREIFEAAARCRVFLMLSRVEPFGMVTIEAMSMGCVPVAWAVATGTREIVRDGEDGLFAPLGDFAALAWQTRRALAGHARLGVSAEHAARGRFDEETMWRGYAQAVADIVAAPQHSRTLAGRTPPAYAPPRRFFQILPAPVRWAVRRLIGSSPRVGYWLRDRRGW